MISVEKSQYPIFDVIDELKLRLETDNKVILTAATGAGKSTILPLLLLDMPFLKGKKIIMLEPRRIAAISIASRMSDLLGEKIGLTVGYRLRFDTCISKQTKIEIVTEAILQKMLVTDSLLEDVGLIIFDEFHERNLYSDIALAMCREVQQYLREDLRILIMSATLNIDNLVKELNIPVVKSAGRSFPVDIRYIEPNENDIISLQVAKAISKSLKNDNGDILAFLPGEYDIIKCLEILQNSILDNDQIVIYPLYGQLSADIQQKAILRDKLGRRKVVLATSVAETSLTIEGVQVVIDSGYTRKMKFNFSNGISRLETVKISLDMAEQRTGRAGRICNGICYRLWSQHYNNVMQQYRKPEIEEAELSSMILDLMEWGIKDIYSLKWISLPPKIAYYNAIKLLSNIGAINNDSITDYGKRLRKIPANPRLSNLLLKGIANNLGSLACDIVSIIESRDPMYGSGNSDINIRIENLHKIRKGILSDNRYYSIEKTASSYRKILRLNENNDYFSHSNVGYLLANAFPERIGCHISDTTYKLANGSLMKFKEEQDLSSSQWIVAATIIGDEKSGNILLASNIDKEFLSEFTSCNDVLKWDNSQRKIISRRDFCIGRIIVNSSIIHNPDKEKIKDIICELIEREGEHLLDFNEDVIQWQYRISSLSKWMPEIDFPDVSISNLILCCREWIYPYIENVSNADDLKKIDLYNILNQQLNWEQKQLLDKLAPEKIEVPSGSKIKLIYNAEGSSPILAVRLQECFGLESTPHICNGKIPILMHLLSPGFKPVQITGDLKSFWDNTYIEVKKELKRRYPKHAWPDNPREEKAIKGIKRR